MSKMCECGSGHLVSACPDVSFDDRYRAANNDGRGFDPDRGDTVDDVVASYEADGATVERRASNTSDVSVVRFDGHLIAIGGDAMGHEPWACRIGQ